MTAPQFVVERSLPTQLSFEELVVRAAELAESDEQLMSALIEARKAAGLTQRQVADMLGIAQPTVAKFEAHDSDPKLSTVRRYALTVGAHIDHVVTTREPVVNPVQAWIASDAPRVTVGVRAGVTSTPAPELAEIAATSLRSAWAFAA